MIPRREIYARLTFTKAGLTITKAELEVRPNMPVEEFWARVLGVPVPDVTVPATAEEREVFFQDLGRPADEGDDGLPR